MSFFNILSRFFRKRPAVRRSTKPTDEPLRLSGNWGYEQEVVGEAQYQTELGAIAGPKTPEGVDLTRTATLVCERDNPHDKNAVAVFIDGAKVAYLSRDLAVEYRKSLKRLDPSIPNAICRAKIVGGWERSKRSKVEQGHFGVKLDLAWPLKRIEEKMK